MIENVKEFKDIQFKYHTLILNEKTLTVGEAKNRLNDYFWDLHSKTLKEVGDLVMVMKYIKNKTEYEKIEDKVKSLFSKLDLIKEIGNDCKENLKL